MVMDTPESNEDKDFILQSIDKLKELCKILNSTIDDLVKKIDNTKSNPEESSDETNENESNAESSEAKSKFNKTDLKRIYEKAHSRLDVTCNLSIDTLNEVKKLLKDGQSKKKIFVKKNKEHTDTTDAMAGPDETKASLKLRLVPIEELMDPKLVNTKTTSSIVKKYNIFDINKSKKKEVFKNKVDKKLVENSRPTRACTKNIPTICLDDSSGSESCSTTKSTASTNTFKKSTNDTKMLSNNVKKVSNGINKLNEIDLRKLTKPLHISIKPVLIENLNVVLKEKKLTLVNNRLLSLMENKLETFDKKDKKNGNNKKESNDLKKNDEAKKKLLQNLDNSSDEENEEVNNDSSGLSSASEGLSHKDSERERNIKVT